MGERPLRVAVLGGGAGGLAAAYRLTESGRPVEVTLYQLGWRLGGKGASGRDAAHAHRILEHGLHVWFGFYHESFALMQRCYSELGRPDGAPLARWEQAFEAVHRVVLMERWQGRWHPRSYTIPGFPGQPGEPRELSLSEALERSAAWLGAAGERLQEEIGDFIAGMEEDLEPPPRWALDLGVDPARPGPWQAQIPELLPGAAQQPPGVEGVSGLLAAARRAVRLAGALREALLRGTPEQRDLAWLRDTIDFWSAIVTGLLADGILQGRQRFEDLDGEELTAWLRRHGFHGEVRTTAFLRVLYDLAFAYVGGDRKRPELAAGMALRNLLRILFAQRGAVMWKMCAGMGDAVFAPLYEVLAARGVRFAFFHWVTALRADPATRRIATIEVVEQATPREGAYCPLVDVDGLPCWPSEPRWEALEEGGRLRRMGVDLEREPNPLGREPRVLRAGEDFDAVVLAIPVGAHRQVCAELIERDPRFARMVATAATVATKSLQLWLRRPPGELGDPGEGAVTGAFDGRFDTCADMRQVVALEGWEPGEVEHLAYLCSVSPASPEADPRTIGDSLKGEAGAFLVQELAQQWPHLRTDDLVDRRQRPGLARLDAQYVRANVRGSERYVRTPPGSVRARLEPGDSGWENLVLAGDWTRTGIDAGSVEAAVVSGLRAADALLAAHG